MKGSAFRFEPPKLLGKIFFFASSTPIEFFFRWVESQEKKKSAKPKPKTTAKI